MDYYHTRKVRILNGAHTSSVLAAYLAGCNYVQDIVCEEKLDMPATYEYLVGAVIAINAGPDVVGIIYKKK